MASSSQSTIPEEAPIPDDDHGADLPLTMMASVVLTNLPHDATTALAAAGKFEKEKGMYSTRKSIKYLKVS